MLTLSNLSPAPGSRKTRKRVGRGPGTGLGKTSGKGHKGQKARSGGYVRLGFEGGQMPIQRRLPKRGFNNVHKIPVAIVNLSDLERFAEDTKIDRQTLIDQGLVSKKYKLIKILGNGDINKRFTVVVDKISDTARQKIVAAGGVVEGI